MRHRPGPEPPTRCPVRFYLITMIFIIFDIEIVFLYPFAVIFKQLHTFGLVEVLVFTVVVLVSFLYLVSNGALSWGPAKRLRVGMPAAHLGVDHRPGHGSTVAPGQGRLGSDMGLEDLQHNFLTGRLEDLVKWARRNSVWPPLRPGLLCHRDDVRWAWPTTTSAASAWRSSGPRRARPTS